MEIPERSPTVFLERFLSMARSQEISVVFFVRNLRGMIYSESQWQGGGHQGTEPFHLTPILQLR